MKKAVLIVNPSSGGEKAKEFETLAEEKLKGWQNKLTAQNLAFFL